MSIAIASKWNGVKSPRYLKMGDPSCISVYTRSANTTVSFSPSVLYDGATFVDVSWGDETTTRYTGSSLDFSHKYAEPGTYDIVMTDTLATLGLPDQYGRTSYGLSSVVELGPRVSTTQRIYSERGVETLSGFRSSSVTSLPKAFLRDAVSTEDSTVFNDLSWLPRGILAISAQAFMNTPVKSLSGMPRVLSIKDFAFNGCTSLTSLAGLPSSLVSLGMSAFEDCTSLASLGALPSSVTKLPAWCFSSTGITTFSSSSHPRVTWYGDSCFAYCRALTSVSLSPGPEYGGNLFRGCTSLSSADVSRLEIVPYGVFSGCTSLETVSLPSCTVIQARAFQSCTSLIGPTSFPLLTSIGSYAFSGCTSLESVTANNVESIGASAFAGGSSAPMALTEVHFNSVYQMGDEYIFRYCPSLGHVYMENRSYKQLLGEFEFRPMSGFPWGAPSGCVFHCRDGRITLTSDAYTVQETSTPGYDYYTDGHSQFTCRVETADVLHTISYASRIPSSSDFYFRMSFGPDKPFGSDRVYNIRFNHNVASAITFEPFYSGTAVVTMSDLADGFDFSQSGIKLLSIDVMAEHWTTFAENAFVGQDELTDVHCERYSRATIDFNGGKYDATSSTRRRIFGAPDTTRFHCSDGIMYGNGNRA